MDKLVEELRALLDSGVTQLEVAREAGVSPPTISRFLRGLNCPLYFRAQRIREAVERLGSGLQREATEGDAMQRDATKTLHGNENVAAQRETTEGDLP